MQGAIVVDGVGAPAAPVAARWLRRVVAALLDDALLGAVTFLTVGDPRGSRLRLAPIFGTGRATGGLWVGLAFLALLGMQACTGSTPGKLVASIAVLDSTTGRPLGLWRMTVRWLAHLLDAILLIGYLRPLWDPNRRTFADSLVGSDAVVLAPVGWRRRTLPAAVVLCAFAVPFAISVQGTSSGSFTSTCDATPTGSGHATVTDAMASWTPPTQTQTRLWFTRQVPVDGGGLVEVTWDTADTTIDESDGTVRVTVSDDAGGRHDTSAATGQLGTSIPVGDATPRSVLLEQVIDGVVVARCEARLP